MNLQGLTISSSARVLTQFSEGLLTPQPGGSVRRPAKADKPATADKPAKADKPATAEVSHGWSYQGATESWQCRANSDNS